MQTNIQAGRHIYRQANSPTYKPNNKHTHTYMQNNNNNNNSQTDKKKQTERQRQAAKHTDRQDRQTSIQTDEHTGR